MNIAGSVMMTASACVCVCSLQDNSVVLRSSAVAYVSLNSPVRGTETLRATASPTLLQLTSDIQRVSDQCWWLHHER